MIKAPVGFAEAMGSFRVLYAKSGYRIKARMEKLLLLLHMLALRVFYVSRILQ